MKKYMGNEAKGIKLQLEKTGSVAQILFKLSIFQGTVP